MRYHINRDSEGLPLYSMLTHRKPPIPKAGNLSPGHGDKGHALRGREVHGAEARDRDLPPTTIGMM